MLPFSENPAPSADGEGFCSPELSDCDGASVLMAQGLSDGLVRGLLSEGASGLQGFACFLVSPLTLDPPSLLIAPLLRSDILDSGQGVSENTSSARTATHPTGKEAQGASQHRLHSCL